MEINETVREDAAPIGEGLPDIITIAKAERASGLSRDTIERAIKRQEVQAFKYGRNTVIRRPEYVRWISSLGTPLAADHYQ